MNAVVARIERDFTNELQGCADSAVLLGMAQSVRAI